MTTKFFIAVLAKKDFEKKLGLLCEELSTKNIEMSYLSRDGRVNSIADEKTVISAIHDILPENAYEDVPERSKEDIKLYNRPVNIKVTSLKGRDNVSSNEGLVYALTGKTCASNWPSIGKTLLSSDIDKEADYYFLVVNKEDPTDVFWTSFKYLKKGYPNGSNLPFQVKWSENRERVERTYEEAWDFLTGLMFESSELMQKPYKILTEVRKKYEC